MIPVDAATVAAVTGGTVQGLDEGTAASDLTVTGVARIDSRDVAPGDLFVCVQGDRVDGHDFVDQARANGAVLSLAERPVPGPFVQVADTIAALTDLARRNASVLPATCTVIGMTGSSGKTSTKDLLAAVLETAGPTVAPPGSFNNEIGMPLTVLRAGADTRYLVLEMGARGVGHIAWLCSIARPRVGMELNVGSAHISEFGDADTIALAKGELVEALPADGIAVLNGDDRRVRGMASRTAAEVVYFGSTPDCFVQARGIEIDDLGRASFSLVVQDREPVQVRLRVSGRHHVQNAMAAATTAIRLGLDPEQVAAALSTAEARSRWRMEVRLTDAGVTVVNDAYNANPESMAAALQAAADIAGDRPLVVVVGEMLELGDLSPGAHRDVGAAAAALGVRRLVAVGGIGEHVVDGAVDAGLAPEACLRAPDADAAADLLMTEVRPGDVVLVKASRAVGLERVAQALIGEAAS